MHYFQHYVSVMTRQLPFYQSLLDLPGRSAPERSLNQSLRLVKRKSIASCSKIVLATATQILPAQAGFTQVASVQIAQNQKQLNQLNSQKAKPLSKQSGQNPSAIEEVLIIGDRLQPKYEATIQTEKLMKAAGTLGDPIQAIFTLPGVVQTDESDPTPAVQGSSPNANAFLIDGIPVEFIFHPFGNSIFNENLIHDFGLNSAGFGAQYGQATGAVFNVSLRDPKNQPLETTLDLSFLRAGALFEGGINKNQSFYFSYRESLLPLYIKKDERDEEEDITFTNLPRSSDYQGKYYWQLNNHQTLTLQLIGAKDKGSAILGEESEEALLDPGLEGDITINSEFHNQSLKWQHYNTKLMLAYNQEKTSSKIGNGEFLDLEKTGWLLRAEQEWSLGSHAFNIGAVTENNTYDYAFDLRLDRCSDFSSDECDFELSEREQDANNLPVVTFNAFLEDRWSFNDHVEVIYGLHFSYDDYLEEANSDPRIRLNWQVTPNLKVTNAVGIYHEIPEIDFIFPVVGNPDLENIQATHYTSGFEYELNPSWNLTTQVYYKDIKNLVVDLEDAENDEPPYKNAGIGKAYGMEFTINKEKVHKWYGWMTVALSKTERTNTLSQETHPFSYDVPVVINTVANYQLTKTWNVGARWTYRTGTLYTPIIGNKENPNYPGFYVPIYGDFNSERAKDFHRLDIRAERPIFNEKGLFFIDLINAYNRNNTSGIEYIPKPDSTEFELNNIEGYGIIPSIGIKIIF